MKKLILLVIVLAIVSGILFWQFGYKLLSKKPSEKQITLKVFGLWEDENLIKPILADYIAQNPKVTIKYELQNIVYYRTRVQTQVLQQGGPDIFLIHNSWLPMFLSSNLLSSLPSDVMNFSEYQNTFYPITVSDFSKNGLIYAIPLGIDGLSLYYNEQMLKEANIALPKDWNEFRDAAKKLTKRDDQGKITQAGAAMGTTNNVDHWSDIVGLLFYQNPGADLKNPNNSAGAEVIKFYTDFVTKPADQVWDINMEPSTQAFYTGKLAFYFAPSWRAYDLKQANSKLNFKTVPVPQLPCPPGSSCPPVGWGTYWAFAVSSRSQNQKEAWKFLRYLTSENVQKNLYKQASNLRLFGEPYSRRSLQQSLLSDPIVGSFVSQAPYYKSWYLASRTFDNGGVNEQIIKYYEDAINATLQGSDALSVLQTTAAGVHQVLVQYKLESSSPSPR